MGDSQAGTLERGREAFAEREWGAAFDQLAGSDRERPLSAEDLERLGESARWSRHFSEMFDAFERAAEAFESADDRRSAARVAVKLTLEHHARNSDALAAGWLGRARRLIEDEPACRERGLVLMCLAQSMFLFGNDKEALLLSEELVDLGRELGDDDVDALGRLVLGHSHLAVGDVNEGTALIDEAMAAALGGGLELWTTGQIFCSTIFACRNRGDWARAGEWSMASLRWCERQSLSGFPGLCRFHRAEIMRFRGDLDRAARDATEAVDELMEAGPRWAAWGLHELGEVRRRQGELTAAAESFRRSHELGFDPQPGLALLRLDEGKLAGARRAIVGALADDSGLIREGRWLLLPAAVEIAVAANDGLLARSVLAELVALGAKLDTSAVRAAAALAEGRVALSESRIEDAATALRHSVRLWSEVDAPYEAAEARELLADAFARLGDDDAAELELSTARASFARMGAKAAARRVAERLSGSRAAPVIAVRTFMFTDIVGSTGLVEMLGDEQWEALLSWHDRTLRACFQAQAGEEVKHEGDGFFVAFAQARTALECACMIQRSLRDHRRENGFAPGVRIGVHIAEATDRGGDYIGRGVHTASRIAGAAGAGEILASRDALDAAGHPIPIANERSLGLKGLTEPVAVATVDWSSD